MVGVLAVKGGHQISCVSCSHPSKRREVGGLAARTAGLLACLKVVQRPRRFVRPPATTAARSLRVRVAVGLLAFVQDGVVAVALDVTGWVQPLFIQSTAHRSSCTPSVFARPGVEPRRKAPGWGLPEAA